MVKKWLKNFSICIMLALCSGIMLFGCGDIYSRLSISISHKGGTSTNIEMTLVEGALSEYEINVQVDGVKNGVSDKIRFEKENGDNISLSSKYEGDGKTVLKITALSHGTTDVTISTVEGNKSIKVRVTVYRKVESIKFSSSKLAIKKNGQIDLNKYIEYAPYNTNQTKVNFELVRIETEEGQFEYSENYASIKNGILKVDPNATLPIDPETNLPYVTIRAISAFDETIKTENYNIPVIEPVLEKDIKVQANSKDGLVTLSKNDKGEYHIVLASNIGFDNVKPENNFLFTRRLSFIIGTDPDLEKDYSISIPEKYLESYQFNPNLSEEEKQEIENFPMLITKIDSTNLEHLTFDIDQKKVGEVVVPFTIKYGMYDGIEDIVLFVRIEVLTFPTEIVAYSGNDEINESNPLKVLNIYSKNLNGTPLQIRTNNDEISNDLYYTYTIDKGTADANLVKVTTINTTEEFVEEVDLIKSGSTIYLHHTYEGVDIGSIDNAYIVIKFTYDLNPGVIKDGSEELEKGIYSYTIEKKIPLAFRSGVDEIILNAERFDIDLTKNEEVILLETGNGVYADEYVYVADTNLFTLNVTRTNVTIIPNKQNLCGEYTLVIKDEMRNLYKTCVISTYIPFAYAEENKMHVGIKDINNYKDEILDIQFEDASFEINVNETMLVKSYRTIKSITLKTNSRIPIEAFNYIINPEIYMEGIAPDGDYDPLINKYVTPFEIDVTTSKNVTGDMEFTYGRFEKGILSVGNRTYTDLLKPLTLTFTFYGFNSLGQKITLTHSIDILIYSLINHLDVSLSNPNIYEYNSVGALNMEKATSVISVNNVLNNATRIDFEVLDKDVKTFYLEDVVTFRLSDLFTITQNEINNTITIVSIPTKEGYEKLSALTKDYLTINRVLSEIYATNFDIQIVVTLEQFGRKLNSVVTIGTLYAIKSERIILNNINSNGIYFDIRNIEQYKNGKDIMFTIEPSNAYNKDIQMIFDGSDIMTCELFDNKVTIKPKKAGVANLRLAFKDSYEKVSSNVGDVLVPTKYIDIRIKIADGSKQFPFEINNVNDFDKMINDINLGNNTFNYVLTNSINITNKNYNMPTNVFDGGLNGLFMYEHDDVQFKNQNSIIGLTINSNDESLFNYGLFTELGSNAVIENLNIVDLNINVDKTYNSKINVLNVGAIAGINNGTIINSRVTGNISVKAFAEEMNIGSFAGYSSNVIKGLPSINNGLGNTDINTITNINVERYQSLKNKDAETLNCLGDLNVGSLVGFTNSEITNIKTLSTISTSIKDVVITSNEGQDDVKLNENVTSLNNNFGGLAGKTLNSNISNVDVIVNSIKATNNIGGLVGYANNTSLNNVKVKFINNGKTGLEASNIIGYNNLGSFIGVANNNVMIDYSYAKSFYNKTLKEIDNINYAGNIVSLLDGKTKAGNLSSDLNVGGLIGLIKDSSNSTINNSYSSVDINTTYKANPMAQDKVNYKVGGLVGHISKSNLRVNKSFVLNNIKMPETIKQTKEVEITNTGSDSEGESGEGSGSPDPGTEPPPQKPVEQYVTKTIEVPSFGYYFGFTSTDSQSNLETSYSVVNYDIATSVGFMSYVDLNGNEVNTEKVQVELMENGEEYKFLMGKYEFVENLNEKNGFKIADNINVELVNYDWFKTSRFNEGFPVLLNREHKIMYTILPSSIVSIVNDSIGEFTNQSHIKVNDKKVILFYNKFIDGIEDIKNNTYQIVLTNSSDNITEEIIRNNTIRINVGVDSLLADFVDVDDSVIIESENPNILKVRDGNKIVTLNEGEVRLNIYCAADPTINTYVDILIVKGVSKFGLYRGNASDINLVTREEQLIIDRINKYNINAINDYYENGLKGVYEKNKNLGYILQVDETNQGIISLDLTQSGKLENGKSYYFESLGDIDIVGFSSGYVNININPFIKTNSFSYGKDIYLNGKTLLTDKEVELFTQDGTIGDYEKVQGIIFIDKLNKEYNFNVIEKAKSLNLNNNTGKTILPTGNADVHITVITSAYEKLSETEYSINEKLNVEIYKSNSLVGILNDDISSNKVEYREGKFRDKFNDSLVSIKDMVVTYEKLSNENQLKVDYKFYLTFDQEKYLANADRYSMNDLKYELIFYPSTNIDLKEKETSKYTFEIKPQSINKIETAFYPSAQKDINNNLNPQENATDYIAPGRHGLLVINVYPKFNDADYFEITVTEEYKQLISLNQMYAVYDNSESGTPLKDYIPANPSAFQLNDYRGIRPYNISNTEHKFDGNLYIRALVASSIPYGVTIEFTVKAYKEGISEAIGVMSVCTLTVSPLPGINATIDGRVNDIILAKTFSKTGVIVATEFESDIYYEIVSNKSTPSDYKLEFTETGFTITALDSALGGDNITLIFRVYKNINGIREESFCKINIEIVEYEILDISVRDSAKNTKNENQLDILNGVTKQLNVIINANINRKNNNLNSNKLVLEKQFAGQGYILNSVRSPNNWYLRTRENFDVYNDVLLNIVNNDVLKFKHFDFLYKNEAYFISAKRISDINVLVLKVTYYYDLNGFPRIYYNGCQTAKDLFEIEFEFRVNIKDNSTYDHPNPLYTFEDLTKMQESSHYILMNDLIISDLEPIKTKGFASLDGNGYRIIIKNFKLDSYKTSEQSSANIGLFEEISENTLIKNMIIDISNLLISNDYMKSLNNSNDKDYIEAYDKINASNISNVNFGVLAAINNGTITNCKIVNLKEGGSNYLYIYTTQNKINDTVPNSQIGGIVGQNNGNITNSYIGINANEDSKSEIYLINNYKSSYKVKTQPFRICGANSIASVAYSNSGKIISTYSNGVGVINTSLLGNDTYITSGFVGINSSSGLLSNVFTQGTNIVRFRASEDYRIESKGNMGGLVYRNEGKIRDAYSNIAIKTNSKRSGGFVFENMSNGTITNAYSTAKNSVGSRAHGAFIGTNEIGEINNASSSSALSSIYYLVVGDEFVNENEVATPIKSSGKTQDGKDALGTSQADPFLYAGSFNGFTFSIGSELNSIWAYTNKDLGPQLISCVTNETYSVRELAKKDGYDLDNSEDHQFNYNFIDTIENLNTAYGDKNNPLIVRNGKEFVDFIINNSNASNVFGGNNTTVSNVRLVDNIDLNEINLNEYKVDGKLLSEIKFNGTLDGNNLEVSGIKLLDNSKGVPKEEFGLFKQIGLDKTLVQSEDDSKYKATIKNVTFNVTQLVATNVKLVGTLAGKAVNAAFINTHIKGSASIQGRDIVGGVVGLIAGDSTLTDVTSSVSVSSVFRTKVSVNELKPYFEYDYNRYLGNYNETLMNGSYICDYSYAGAIAGIIDANNTDILDLSKATPDNNVLDSIFNVNETTRLTTKYRTDEPTSPNIKNLKVYGNVLLTGEHVGGLFGYVGNHTHIYNSKFELSKDQVQEINGLHFSGGIAGENHGILEKVTIEYDEVTQKEYDEKINSKAEVVGNKYIFKSPSTIAMGGLVGYNQDAIIIDSYSKINVYNDKAYIAGGLVGYNKGYGLIQHSYATGLVQSKYVIGGILGYVNASKYCWNGVRNYAFKNVAEDGTIKYLKPNWDNEGNTVLNEKVVLDYVVALNTWNSETLALINDNFKDIYSYAEEGGLTSYYSFKYSMPEIGNQFVDKMYKVIEETSIQDGEESKSFVNKFENVKNKETASSGDSVYPYNYKKNIGSFVGRFSSVGSSYKFEDLKDEKGATFGSMKALSADLDIGILDVFNTSNIKSKLVDGTKGKSVKELEQKSIDIYSSINLKDDPNLIKSNQDIDINSPYNKEYNAYNYYNYLGWQRSIDYLLGIKTDNGEDKKNKMEENAFNKWIKISIDGDQEKVYMIDENTAMPKYIIGIYSNLIELKTEDDWKTYINGSSNTKNKFFAVTKDINLNMQTTNFGKFEGNLIGSKQGSNPTVTVNVTGLKALFDLIENAQITNVNFVINYLSTNSLQYFDKEVESVGAFANVIKNSNIVDSSIEVNYNKGNSGTFISDSNSNIGGIFGKVLNTNISISENAEKENTVAYSVYNMGNWKIQLKQAKDNSKNVNIGLFAGYVNNSKINYLPFNTKETTLKVESSTYNINDLYVGGIIGKTELTNYSNINISKFDNLNINVYQLGDISINNLYVGGLFGQVIGGSEKASGSIGKVAHLGSILIGPNTNDGTTKINTDNLYVGGVVGAINSVSAVNNISNGVTFDASNNITPVSSKPKDENFIKVLAGDDSDTLAIGGLVGKISASNVMGKNEILVGKSESGNNADINVKVSNADKNLVNYVGGIIGLCEGYYTSCEVAKLYNSGNINVESDSINNKIGGIIGHADTIKIYETYNAGKITLSAEKYNLGGIVGSIGNKLQTNSEVSKILNSISYADFDVNKLSNEAVIGGILGLNNFNEAKKVELSKTVSMSRTIGVKDNNGYIEGIAKNVISSENTDTNYYIIEFANNSKFGTGLSYGKFSSIEWLDEDLIELSKGEFTPKVKCLYMLKELRILDLNMTKGSKFNPNIITNQDDINRGLDGYNIISVNGTLNITKQIADTFTGVFASTNNTLINYSSNKPFVNNNNGILSGVKLNIQNSTNTHYLTTNNNIDGLIYNCGIVGVINNKNIIAPIAETNYGKILRTGTAFVNKTTELLSESSSFVLDNESGIIAECYSTVQNSNIETINKIYGLVGLNKKGDITNSYFAGSNNGNNVKDDKYNNRYVNLYYERYLTIDELFNSSDNKVFTSPWKPQGINVVSHYNHGYPIFNIKEKGYEDSLLLRTTYEISGFDYKYNHKAENDMVSNDKMFLNMGYKGKYFISSDIHIGMTYSIMSEENNNLNRFVGVLNGLNKKITTNKPLFEKIGSSTISNIDIVGEKSYNAIGTSVLASVEIINSVINNISFENCKTNNALLTPKFICDNSNINSSISNITLYLGNSVGSKNLSKLGGIVSIVEGTNNKINISNINLGANSIKFSSNYPSDHLGGLFGSLTNVILNNAKNNSEFINSSSITTKVGGIAGYTYNVEMKKCNNFGNIKLKNSNSYIGGLIADAFADLDLYNCYNMSKEIQGKSYIGGLISCSENLTISNCSNSSKIIGDGDYIGGIVGGVASILYNKSITNLGEIINNKINPEYVGGIYGYVEKILDTNNYNLTNNGDINIIYTNSNNYNSVKGEFFIKNGFKLIDVDYDPDYYEKFNHISDIKYGYSELKNISLFIGNIKEIKFTSNSKIYVEENVVKYDMSLTGGVVYYSFLGAKVDGFEKKIKIAKQHYSKWSTDAYGNIYYYSIDKEGEIILSNEILVKYKKYMCGPEKTVKEWNNKFSNQTFEF